MIFFFYKKELANRIPHSSNASWRNKLFFFLLLQGGPLSDGDKLKSN